MRTSQQDISREPLSGPFLKEPSENGVHPSPAVRDLALTQVRALLKSSPAYYSLKPERREEMEDNLAKIAAYTAALVQEDWALSKQLGQTPMVRRRVEQPAAMEQAQGPATQPKEKPPEEFAPRAASNIAKITRETLNAIAFPTFVADLIKGTYIAIIHANYIQIEQFATLLANVARTVDEFMVDNITENQARDYVVQSYPSHFEIDKSEDSPKVKVRDNAPDTKPDFKTSFGLNEDVDVSDENAEEVLVPAARRKLAQNRHQMLSTMVLMGINRIVVTSGHINAKMGFRINTQDLGRAHTASEFDEQNTVHLGYGGGLMGAIFGGPEGDITNTVTYVSTTKKDSQDDLTVEADLTGEVDLKFKSDYFPVGRFADPKMIALIQGNTPNPAANTPASASGATEQKQTAAAAKATA